MANRYATKSGAWSDVSVWDGGATLPQSGDTVRPNGFTVTIDQDITVTELRNNASAPASSGGTFSLAVGWTITANIIGSAGGTPCAGYSGSGGTRYIVGNVTGDVGYGITTSSQDLLVITGNITCTNNYKALYGPSSINAAITGNVTAGTTSGANAIDCGGTNNIAVTGNVTSSAANAAINATGSGAITVTGTITASSAFAGIVSSSSSCTIIANGDMVAGSNGKQPLYANGPLWISSSATISHTYPRNNGGVAGLLRYLYTGGTNLGQPTAANVRLGTTFGASSEYTGTLAVPSPTLVAIGVATDNTVGSYAPSGGASAADIADAVWDEARSGHTTSGTFGATSQWVSSGDTSGVTELLTRIPDATPGTEGGLPVLSADLTVIAALDSSTQTQIDTIESAVSSIGSQATTVERSVSDTNAITFAWPVSGATITGTRSLNNGSYGAVAGAIAFLRSETGKHYYTLAYNVADRPAAEGQVRYKFIDGTYTGYVVLRTAAAGLSQDVLDQLDDIESSVSTYIAGISAVASTTTGTIIGFPSSLNIGDSYTEEANSDIHVFIRDENDDPITAVGSFNFTDPEFAPEVNITQSGSTGRVKAVVTFVEASPEDYLKVEIPSSQSRRASPGTATIQCLLKWVDTDGKVLAQKTLSKQAVTWNEMV